MITLQEQDSPERQFLSDTPIQYIVQLMKHRDYESKEVWTFDKDYVPPGTRRRKGGVKEPYTWTPNYAQKRRQQVKTPPIPAIETQRRIYSVDKSLTNVYSELKRINGKDFQLFWCVEDYKDHDYRGHDAHSALFIAGLHTAKLNAKYSQDAILRERFCEDYGVRDIIAKCIERAKLSVTHTYASHACAQDKYETQIHSAHVLKTLATQSAMSVDMLKTFYLTKSINDPTGSMCFGFNRTFDNKFDHFLQNTMP